MPPNTLRAAPSTAFLPGWEKKFEQYPVDSLRAFVREDRVPPHLRTESETYVPARPEGGYYEPEDFDPARAHSTDVAGSPIGQQEVAPGGAGVGFGTRAGASFFRGDQEKEYLRRRVLEEGDTIQRGRGGAYPEHPGVPKDNELYVRSGADGKLRRIDPSGTEWGDLADMLGYSPEYILGLVGQIAGGTAGSALPGPGTTIGAMAGGAVGSAGGDAIRQVGAEIIDPEVHEFSPGEMAEAAAYGAGGEALPVVLKALGQGVKQAARLPARAFRKQPGTFWKSGKEGLGLKQGSPAQRVLEAGEQLEIDPRNLPVSATTGSRVAQSLESTLEKSPWSGRQFEPQKEAFQEEMAGALGKIRSQIGGGELGPFSTQKHGLGSGVSSAVDAEKLGPSLIDNQFEMNALIDRTISNAGGAFEQAIGRPLHAVQALTPNLDRLAKESGRQITMQPGAPKFLKKYAGPEQFFESTKRDNLEQVLVLREIAGKMMGDKNTEEAGSRLYRAVMDDLDETYKNFVKHEPTSYAASGNFRKLIDTARRQHDVSQSPIVKQLFPQGAPNVLVMDEVAERISSPNVGVEAIRLLKEQLGVGMAEGSMTNVASRLRGRTDIGLPRTERGGFIWDQVRQLYLDNLFHKISQVPEQLDFGGQRLFNSLFGSPKQARVTEEIFGEATRNLRAFAELVRDSQMSKNFFTNWSNTGAYNEMMGLFSMEGVKGAVGRLGVAKQFTQEQGPNVFLGREFFQKGQLPNVYKYLEAHTKLMRTTRGAGQVLSREYGAETGRGSMKSIGGWAPGASPEPVQPSPAQSREVYR